MSGGELELTQLVSRLERRLSQRLVRRLAAADSSLKEWRVPSCLADRGGRTMSDIARALAAPPPTTSKLVDAMVAENLVYRRSDDEDRRRVLIFLAPRGRKKYEVLAPLVEQEQAELSALADEKDLRELVRLLTQLAERVG